MITVRELIDNIILDCGIDLNRDRVRRKIDAVQKDLYGYNLQQSVFLLDAVPYNVSTGSTDGCTGYITNLGGHQFNVGEQVTVSAGFPSSTNSYTILAKSASNIEINILSTSPQLNAVVKLANSKWSSDNAAFPLPFVKTTSPVMKYYINSTTLVDVDGKPVTPNIGGYETTIRKISRVFIQAVNRNTVYYTRTFYGDEFIWLGKNPYLKGDLSKIVFVDIPVKCFDRSAAQDAYVLFNEDPDTSADAYYIEAYLNPVELVDEDTVLSIDGDQWRMALIDGVSGEFEQMKYGRSARWDRYQKYWIPKFKSEWNKGQTIEENCTDVREC